MIVYKLSGGLGNQLNQYAAARYLADKYSAELFFDTSSLDKDWQYVLYIDKIVNKLELVEKSFNLNSLIPVINYEKSNGLDYQENNNYLINSISGHPFDYIKEVSLINLDIKFDKLVLSNNDINLLKLIKETNSVAIHIRRGDYINIKETKDKFGVLTMDYYNKAIEHIEGKVKQPKYFVFSNDPVWASENFSHLKDVVIVKHNNSASNSTFDNYILYRYLKRKMKFLSKKRINSAVNDFFLMQSCKHFIIANSTFSWWSGYLGTDLGKIVLCPHQWSKYRNSNETVPNDWIKIEY